MNPQSMMEGQPSIIFTLLSIPVGYLILISFLNTPKLNFPVQVNFCRHYFKNPLCQHFKPPHNIIRMFGLEKCITSRRVLLFDAEGRHWSLIPPKGNAFYEHTGIRVSNTFSPNFQYIIVFSARIWSTFEPPIFQHFANSCPGAVLG